MMGSLTFIMVAFMWREKKDAIGFRLGDLFAEEIDERGLAHEGGVEDFAGLERGGFLENLGACRRCR